MAGAGTPSVSAAGAGRRIAVIGARWHATVVEALVSRALQALTDAGVTDVTVVRVPGAFELPVACARLASDFDGLVALGVVIRGGTPHFDYVCQAATMGITNVACQTGTPIGFGLLTCENDEQALARCGLPTSAEDKGYEASMAVLDTLNAIDAALAN